MKKFSIKLLLLIAPVFVFLLLSLLVFNHYLSDNSFYKIDKSINILILGNSHPECALNDSLINHSINLSNSADSYFYTYYKLQKLVEANATIHTLILEYTNNAFSEEMNAWIYSDMYLGDKLLKYSHIIPFNENVFLFLKNPAPYLIAEKEAFKTKWNCYFNKSKYRLYTRLSWGGYLFLVRDKIPLLKQEFERNKTVVGNIATVPASKINIEYLKKIASYCKANNIKLILFRSPLHKLYKRNYELQFDMLLKNELKELTFWDYSNYPLRDGDFGDLEHLNYRGAIKISKVINLQLSKTNLTN